MMTLKLLEVMPNVKGCVGLGNYDLHQMCVMAMCVAEYRLRRGEPIGAATDKLECVCPLLRQLAIDVNDCVWPSEEARTKWALEMVPKLLNTYDESHEFRRTRAVIQHLVNKVLVPELKAAGYMDWAASLERATGTLQTILSALARENPNIPIRLNHLAQYIRDYALKQNHTTLAVIINTCCDIQMSREAKDVMTYPQFYGELLTLALETP